MDTSLLRVEILNIKDMKLFTPLTQQLNPDKSPELIELRQAEMFAFGNYTCFGLLEGDKLIGLMSGWTTVKIYSGKQLEIDNVIVDSSIQSRGYGKYFLDYVENWARARDYISVELNTYVHNFKSHKFYFNQGYQIRGYHMTKQIG